MTTRPHPKTYPVEAAALIGRVSRCRIEQKVYSLPRRPSMAGVKHVTEKQQHATHVRSHGRQNALPPALPSPFFFSAFSYSSILHSYLLLPHFRTPHYYETNPFSGSVPFPPSLNGGTQTHSRSTCRPSRKAPARRRSVPIRGSIRPAFLAGIADSSYTVAIAEPNLLGLLARTSRPERGSYDERCATRPASRR